MVLVRPWNSTFNGQMPCMTCGRPSAVLTDDFIGVHVAPSLVSNSMAPSPKQLTLAPVSSRPIRLCPLIFTVAYGRWSPGLVVMLARFFVILISLLCRWYAFRRKLDRFGRLTVILTSSSRLFSKIRFRARSYSIFRSCNVGLDGSLSCVLVFFITGRRSSFIFDSGVGSRSSVPEELMVAWSFRRMSQALRGFPDA